MSVQGSKVEGKRQVLVALSSALVAMSDRMAKQGDAAKRITALAARAEQIAQRSWDLTTNANNRHFQRDCVTLIGEVAAFAKEIGEAADRAKRDAMLGREVAAAIAAHADGIAQLARDIDVLPDAAAVRARLRPLSETLAVLPQRMKANTATLNDVDRIAARAAELAKSGDDLLASGAHASQVAVSLCRDLRRFAEEASAVSLEMARGSAMAVRAINGLAETTVSLSRGQSSEPATAHERMMALAKDAPSPLIGKVWT